MLDLLAESGADVPALFAENKMFCEQEKSVTLTKNNIGSFEDSYREGLARGKFMQMKQEIQFVCVNKYPLALCEENHLLKM